MSVCAIRKTYHMSNWIIPRNFSLKSFTRWNLLEPSDGSYKVTVLCVFGTSIISVVRSWAGTGSRARGSGTKHVQGAARCARRCESRRNSAYASANTPYGAKMAATSRDSCPASADSENHFSSSSSRNK